MQAGVFFLIRGVDVDTLVFAPVQLGSGPQQDHLEALSPLLFVLLRTVDPRLQRPLAQQDLWAHAEQVQCRFIQNVALVGVAISGEKERPGEKNKDLKFKIKLQKI